MALTPRILALASLTLLLLAAPCHAEDGAIAGDFTPCRDAATHNSMSGAQCATIIAPLDHASPGTATIELFVRKFPAAGDPQGQLWLVAGGPGESGASFYPFIETLRAAAPGFDLIIPDHRGTGFSTRLCPDEESPQSDGGAALANQEWGSCFGALNAQAERTRSFTISNAAHDLRLLMTKLDRPGRRYLYGVSYGTQLVLRALTLGSAEHIDGVILDSLVPLDSNATLDLSQRSAVTDAVGREVLRGCDTKPECRAYFPGGAEAAVRKVLARSDIEQMVGPRPKFQLAAMLDFPETRAMLPNVIAGLQAGDPAWFQYALARLTSIASGLGDYAQGGSSIPLVNLISRSENNARPDLTAETVEREAQTYLFASPLPSLLLAGGIPTYKRDASFGVLPKAIPPTIVLHGTLDPKTAFVGAQEHVAALAGAGTISLIPIKDAPHFILFTAPDEFTRLVRAFIAQGPRAPQP